MTKKITPKKIIKSLEENREELRKHSVKKIGLFGSYLKGKQTKKSDIDIIVKFKQTDFDNYMELKFLLEKIFNKKVDLVIETNIKPALKYIKEEAHYAKV